MIFLRQLPAGCAWLTLALASGGCSDLLAPRPTEAEAPALARGSTAVTVPFKARFYTDLAALHPDPACAPPRLLNTQVGEGQATALGRFTVQITFCVDASDFLDDGQLTEGESLPYDNGVGTLVAANGDEMYIEISGAVLPSTDPDFDFEFSDPFAIVGGTGRFAGALGAGTTDSFVRSAIQRTTHEWTGTMTLLRGS